MDIQQTVIDLLATGMTQQQLADKAGCSQSLIAAMVSGTRGKQTSMNIGLRLVQLHEAASAAGLHKHPHSQQQSPRKKT